MIENLVYAKGSFSGKISLFAGVFLYGLDLRRSGEPGLEPGFAGALLFTNPGHSPETSPAL